MGSNGTATVLFLSGIVAALWLLRELVSIAMGETARGNLIRAMSAMVVVVVLMTGTHQFAKARAQDPLKGVTMNRPLLATSMHIKENGNEKPREVCVAGFKVLRRLSSARRFTGADSDPQSARPNGVTAG